MYYTLESLQDAWKSGYRCQFMHFWGHTPTPDGTIGSGCLSQWWMQPFQVEGITYSCAEQYMMAEKARLFRDDTMLPAIMAASTPKEMKALGRKVKGFDGTVWDAACVDIVKTANMAKFSQNPRLLAFLLGTNGRILVEASPMDRIWGIGMGRNNPDANNPLKWRGRNLLGFALTEVRDKILNESSET